MGSAYNRVIETRKELTKQLLAEMEQGELPWMKGWKQPEPDRIIQ